MPLSEDLQQILDIVSQSDPSFRQVENSAIESCLDDVRRCVLEGSKEGFLISAMRLLSLPGNGHTRLIPNNAIEILPLRFLSIAATVQLTYSPAEIGAPKGRLLAVNGAPIDQIEIAAESLLAGTAQRKRVIGPMLFAWPYALAHLGFASGDDTTEYRIQEPKGRITNLRIGHKDRVSASSIYPQSEHGRANPTWKPLKYVEIDDHKELGVSIKLPSFFDPSEVCLQREVLSAAAYVKGCSHRTVLVDVRGNTGGDFLLTMPLIDAIAESACKRAIVLVDKFTFSAAIVFVALLKHRLGHRFKLIGEEMGDGLTFFAEGGALDLPSSGAVVRYSSAFHDWEHGTTDETTPPEIARHIVGAGALVFDKEWIHGSCGEDTQRPSYRRMLKEFGS